MYKFQGLYSTEFSKKYWHLPSSFADLEKVLNFFSKQVLYKSILFCFGQIFFNLAATFAVHHEKVCSYCRQLFSILNSVFCSWKLSSCYPLKSIIFQDDKLPTRKKQSKCCKYNLYTVVLEVGIFLFFRDPCCCTRQSCVHEQQVLSSSQPPTKKGKEKFSIRESRESPTSWKANTGRSYDK